MGLVQKATAEVGGGLGGAIEQLPALSRLHAVRQADSRERRCFSPITQLGKLRAGARVG